MGILVKHDIKVGAVGLEVEWEIPQVVGISAQRSST